MKGSLRTGLVWTLLLLAAAQAMGQSRSRMGPLLTDERLQRVGYGTYWDASLPLLGGDHLAGIHLLDENVYLFTRRGLVYAVQADTGLLRWTQPLDDYVVADRPPTHVVSSAGAGPAVFVTRSFAYFVDRYAGRVVERTELPAAAMSGGAANESLMFLGGTDGLAYALRWMCHRHGNPLVYWKVLVPGGLSQTPILRPDGRLYYASNTGVVYCVRGFDQKLLWTCRPARAALGGMFVDDTGVFVASADYHLRKLDPDDGTLLRQWRFPGPLREAPIVVDGSVYQYAEDEGLFAIDSDSGEVTWHRPDGRRYVARQADWLVVMDDAGNLQIVGNADGRTRHTLDLPAGVLVGTNRRDAVLFLAAGDGRLLCAKPIGFAYLRREAVQAARATLHEAPTSGAADGSTESVFSTEPDSANPFGIDDPLRSRIRQ